MNSCIISSDLSAEKLRLLLHYDPASGGLFWKKRTATIAQSFPSMTDGSIKTFNKRHAGNPALTYQTAKGYRCGLVLGHSIKAHRAALCISLGYWPTEVDHINGCKHDNRLVNLREVSRSENCRNRRLRSDNTSGTPGVTYHRKNRYYEATVSVGVGDPLWLGAFETRDEAVAARLSAQKSNGYMPNHGAAMSNQSAS